MRDQLPDILWLTHLAATLFLVGLIWVVQVVNYPLFAQVGAEQFHGYWRGHTRLVAPSMLTEAVTACCFLRFGHPASRCRRWRSRSGSWC